MTRTLPHDASILQEIDGAVKFDDLNEILKVRFWGEFSGKKEEESRKGFNDA